MKQNALSLLFVFGLLGVVRAQNYNLMSTREVYTELQKLHRGLRVLYIAAHPDDENTRLIAWLENDRHIETAYLSLTRGDGGQNLVGPEQGDALGLIRTYELLEARKIDGGQQYFTRAVDFGFSKSAEESFAKWGKDAVLADVVYVIRQFRPHVIITRFPPNRNAGHGHHEASAILAAEAFDLAGNAEAFSDQLRQVQLWQPEAMFYNASTWWRKELDEKTAEELKSENIHRINVGTFDPVSGKSTNEIAAEARSKHRSQAFGTAPARGEQMEYLQLLKGEWKDDVFESMPGIWSRSPEHKAAIAEVIRGYDFFNPAANLKLLNDQLSMRLAQRNLWAEPADIAYVNAAVDRIRIAMMGIRVEAFAGEHPVVIGTDFQVTVQVYNASLTDQKVKVSLPGRDTVMPVASGKQVEWKRTIKAPNEPSQPYWLRQPHDMLHVVDNPALLGQPMQHDLMVEFEVSGGASLKGKTELHRKWTDRSIGEIVQPMVFVPPVSVEPGFRKLGFPNSLKPKLKFKVMAMTDIKESSLQWTTTCAGISPQPLEKFDLKNGQSKEFSVGPYSFNGQNSCNVNLNCSTSLASQQSGSQNSGVMDGLTRSSNSRISWIRYPHIPELMLLEKAETTFVPVDMKKGKGAILYIEGAGDGIDEALERIGYMVVRTPLDQLGANNLNSYKAIVVGIRAYNTNDALGAYHEKLIKYVEHGGNLIVQYNTTFDLKSQELGPYPFKISRDRVTEENAEPKFLVPGHTVYQSPNAITKADFDGWVQERGLYFASEWDANYTPLIAWRDTGEEKDSQGALLHAKHGKGNYFYTGIAFFRQIPEGVPGAYRLLQNMIECKRK